jgi:hypothetical protein
MTCHAMSRPHLSAPEASQRSRGLYPSAPFSETASVTRGGLVSNVIHDFVRPVADALSVPLILALGLVVIVTITHFVSWLWYLLQQRGRRPLVVAVGPGRERVEDSVDPAVLNDNLLAYLAADARGSYVIAPGAGGPAAPRVITEALEPSHGWQAAALRFAVARQPSFLVSIAWYVAHNEQPWKYHAVVRISRTPGDRIMASGSFDGQSEEDIIETVGCFASRSCAASQESFSILPAGNGGARA